MYVGPQSGEYKLFTEYYSKLIDTLPTSDLSHYFVSHRVISLTDHDEITKPTTPSYMAVKLLLSRVSSPLREEDDIEPLNKMLAIMEHHGNNATKALSLEMRTRMFTEAAERSRQGSLLYRHASVFILYCTCMYTHVFLAQVHCYSIQLTRSQHPSLN